MGKYDSWNRGQTEALLNRLGGQEVAASVASGELTVEIKDGKVEIKPTPQLLVDKNGRGIPFKGMSKVVDANRAFHLAQLEEFDYAAILAKLQRLFGPDYKFMMAAEFEEKYLAVIKRVESDSLIKNLLRGPHFPFPMPQLVGDLGGLLDDVLVPMMERSYLAQFPERTFTNYRHGELTNQVSYVAETRQERLVDAMAKGSMCVVYFPTALQGFSIPADREFVKHLPEDVILSGMEVPVAVAAYPGIFGRDFHTPGLDMTALQWQSTGTSLYFRALDGRANFVSRSLNAYGSCSGGFSVLR